MITAALQSEVEKQINDRIVSIAPLSAANNAQIYRLSLGTGRMLVAKVAERGLDTEAFMLKYLADNSKLPVPKIYYSNEHVIVMQCVEAQAMVDDQGQQHAAELLAALHQVRAESYGLERDTLIGSLKQPNPQTKDWAKFFIENRLLHMAQEAVREAKMDAKILKQVEKLAPKFTGMLKNPNPPSLIHGDIWGGNILAGRGKILAFVDPAIYYADPEIELAFIRSFNTFNSLFFTKYNEINPIKPGFYEERADVYSIYPLLVHTRLFGSSYARKVQKILDKFN
jgi:fructosamine-3-kinase